MSRFRNINHLGHVPFNPDNLLNDKDFLNRPAGFSFDEITTMYWTVKSFQVNINIITITPEDPYAAFINAGGTSAGLIGATAGLGAATDAIGRAPGSISMNGHTKILTNYKKGIRYIETSSCPSEGVRNGKLANPDTVLEDLKLDKEKNPPRGDYLQSSNMKPTEGDLCSAGPVHTLAAGNAYLKIDLSDIIYSRYRYYPKIYFLGSAGGSTFSTNPMDTVVGSGTTGLTVVGGIILMNTPLTLYGSIVFSPNRMLPPTATASGTIKPGKRCCDRFYYDGYDKERQSECKEKVCEDEPEGVYRKIKTQE